MAIPVKHTIILEKSAPPKADPEIYTKGIGLPPGFHVVCSCQWEGWAHSEYMAEYFVRSHIAAQNYRGNPVEVINRLKPISVDAKPVELPIVEVGDGK